MTDNLTALTQIAEHENAARWSTNTAWNLTPPLDAATAPPA